MNQIDHIVINTRDRLDEAVICFESMGFTVTARGYHTLGSINHTIVFKTDYLELLGYPADKLPERPELTQRPAGLLATVLKANDADQVRATLLKRELAPRPTIAFSRPIDLGNGKSADVKFRVTSLEPDAIPASWVYYCQHLTPELVWYPAWQIHMNGCVAMTQLSINVSDLKAAVQLYSRAMDVTKLEDTGENSCILHLLNFEIILLVDSNKPLGMFKLVFGTVSLEKVAGALAQGGIGHHKADGRIVADTLSRIGCILEFVSIV